MTPLKQARKQRGWRLIDVVDRVRRAGGDTDASNLSRLERSQQSASPDLAERLVQVFGGELTEMQILFPRRFMSEAAPMQAHQISNTGSKETAYYHVIELDECRQRSLETLQKGVLNDLQQADPQTCSAFADYCAERLDGEVTLALCLSRIHGDNSLLQMGLAELHAHVEKSREAFCAFEVERRIDALQQQAQAKAMAAQELDHE